MMSLGPSARRYFALHGSLPGADERGHRTRYSDSSLYDEVCVLCGGTDAMELQREQRGTWGPCPRPMSDREIADATKNWMVAGAGI